MGSLASPWNSAGQAHLSGIEIRHGFNRVEGRSASPRSTGHTMNKIQNQTQITESPGWHKPRPEGAEMAGFPGAMPARRRLYRSRHGMIFGVCRGLAEYGQLSVFWVRVILVALTLLTWILPFVILYTVAAFLMKPESTLDPAAEEDWRSYCTFACTQSIALAQLKRELDQVEYRILRLERDDSARQYDWERRLRGES